MSRTSWWPDVIRVAALVVLLLGGAIGPAASSRADDNDLVEVADASNMLVATGFTEPFRTVTLAAVRTGRIAALPVREGEQIAANEVALQLDDGVQQQRVEIATALAQSMLEIELAQLRLEAAELELSRLEELDDDSYASTKELTDAKGAVDIARVELELARFKHAQARREQGLQQQLLEELQVRAPFDGYVAERLHEVGDTVEEREGVLSLVQLDPLIVTLDCPLEWAAQVRDGQQVTLHPIDAIGEPRVGTVSFVSRVADPASQTFKVRIDVPNRGAGWLSGMRVRAEFAGSGAAALAEQQHASLKQSVRPGRHSSPDDTTSRN